MERRRCLRHDNWLALLTGAAAGFLICLALTAQPPAVECRETVKFMEEAGDPDMPDRFQGGPVSVPGLTVSLPGDAWPLEIPAQEKPVARFNHRHQWREYTQAERTIVRLIWTWSSVASWLFVL